VKIEHRNPATFSVCITEPKNKLVTRGLFVGGVRVTMLKPLKGTQTVTGRAKVTGFIFAADTKEQFMSLQIGLNRQPVMVVLVIVLLAVTVMTGTFSFVSHNRMKNELTKIRFQRDSISDLIDQTDRVIAFELDSIERVLRSDKQALEQYETENQILWAALDSVANLIHDGRFDNDDRFQWIRSRYNGDGSDLGH